MYSLEAKQMTKEIKNGYEAMLNEKNEELRNNEVIELITVIDEQKIGYCKYGTGKYIMLFICGGVGKFKQLFFATFFNEFS